jgi:hypothetical protein
VQLCVVVVVVAVVAVVDLVGERCWSTMAACVGAGGRCSDFSGTRVTYSCKRSQPKVRMRLGWSTDGVGSCGVVRL